MSAGVTSHGDSIYPKHFQRLIELSHRSTLVYEKVAAALSHQTYVYMFS